jgi:hypothetical protein
MAVSTALSVASFSIVLTETFIAVAASTLAPATFVSFLRAMKAKAEADAGNAPPGGITFPEFNADSNALTKGFDGIKDLLKGVGDGVRAIDEIELLVPKTAKIHAEFEFEATEQYATEGALGGFVNVVAISAGYSSLFQTASRNRITLDIDYAVVNYRL